MWYELILGRFVYMLSKGLVDDKKCLEFQLVCSSNLPPSAFSSQLAQSVCSVYMGWAALPNRGVFKMVTSIGWNAYFGNTAKTVEPWLLHEFSADFYGEELKVIIGGYLRPEADYSS